LPHGGDGTFRSDTEWADTPHGRYESFVLDVVRNVDARFPTIRSRRDRALGGDSEGAYAAVNLALRHLGEFSIAESWSGYFIQRAIGPFAHTSPLKVAANSPAVYVPAMRARLHHLPLHVFIYLGKREREVPKGRAFTAELRTAGGHVTFALYPGSHDWRLWRQQAPHMLEYADRWFFRP
jgi:enterochelin esterase-like enzyme